MTTHAIDPRPAPTPWQRKRGESLRLFRIGLYIGAGLILAYAMWFGFCLLDNQVAP